MRIKEPILVKIGMWATQCCHRDLYQISTDTEIENILEDWDDGVSHDVWETKREALLDIRKGFDGKEELLFIDKMLADTKEIKI